MRTDGRVIITTIIITLGALTALLVATPAAACMCTAPPPPAQAVEEAYAVFAGRVVAVEKTERRTDYGRMPRIRATVELSAVWKGVPEGDTVEVWTGLGGGDCGYGFEEGVEVLVYATALAEGDLQTDICTRTGKLAAAVEQGELEALGEPARRPGGAD